MWFFRYASVTDRQTDTYSYHNTPLSYPSRYLAYTTQTVVQLLILFVNAPSTVLVLH